MWNLLLAFFFGSTVSSTRPGRRLISPLLILLGRRLVAGFIYASVVFHAVN